MSASCVVLAVVDIARQAHRPAREFVPTVSLLVAAAVGSSTWIGGVMFALAAPCIAIAMIAVSAPEQRLPFVMKYAAAMVIAIWLAAPLLIDQYVATSARGIGSPLSLQLYEVLGPAVPDGVRRIFDLPAYWFVFLVVEFPAIYPIGAAALARLMSSRALPADERRVGAAMAVLGCVSLLTVGLLVSRIGDNNDLGWRAILPAVIVLIVFSAVRLSRWIVARPWVAGGTAILAILPGLPDGLENLRSYAAAGAASSAIFSGTGAMWAAVRRYSRPDERVANNPLFLQDLTPWPVNLSWALLANRRSCFAGRELALAFAPLPPARREQIDALFIRIFAGDALSGDIELLAKGFGCRIAVVTAQDGAWARDPFATSNEYRMVEMEPGKWRIYRSVDEPGV